MLEKEIESRLVIMAKKRGCIPVKLLSSSFNGLPDRLILAPGEKMSFIELKAPGKKPRPLQLKRHKELRNLGFKVYVVDSIDMIVEVLDEICAT